MGPTPHTYIYAKSNWASKTPWKREKNPQKIINEKKNGLKVGVVFIFWAWVFLLYIIDLNKYNIVWKWERNKEREGRWGWRS